MKNVLSIFAIVAVFLLSSTKSEAVYVKNNPTNQWDYLGNSPRAGGGATIGHANQFSDASFEKRGDWATLSIETTLHNLARGFDGFAGNKADGKFGYKYRLKYKGVQDSFVLAKLNIYIWTIDDAGEKREERFNYDEWFQMKEPNTEAPFAIDLQSISTTRNIECGGVQINVDYGYTSGARPKEPNRRHFRFANEHLRTHEGDSHFHPGWSHNEPPFDVDRTSPFDQLIFDDYRFNSWRSNYEYDREKGVDKLTLYLNNNNLFETQ